jgi:hypothetical protein
VALALALTGSVLLVVDVTLGRAAGLVAGAGTLVLHCGLWGVMPLVLRRTTGELPARGTDEAGSGE